MELVYVSVALLSLLSVGHSAPVTNCESLIQPVGIQRDGLLGKWIYLAESTNIPGSGFLTKMLVESTWGKFTAANENDAIDGFYSQKIFGRCVTFSVNYTLVNNTVSMVQPFPATGTLLNTGCPDCLVFHTRYTIGKSTYNGLQLLSRRRKLTAAELEEFKKQAECVNLPQPAVMDPEKDLCPDESPSQASESIDLTNAMKSMGSEAFNIFDQMINSESGLSKIVNALSGGLSGFKLN